MSRIEVEVLETRRLMAATLPVFVQTNLISDGAVAAQRTDANLVNPWGIATSPGGQVWVGDNGKGSATVYDQAGAPITSPITVPPPAGGSGSSPTGVVLNRGRGFNITSGGSTGPSIYLFATEDGTISGWNSAVSANAVLAVDNSAVGPGAVYKGLALAGGGKNERLYAANFRAGTIDVFDSGFKPATLPAGAFTDSNIPVGFAPFNIVNLHNRLYVSYAEQNGQKHDDIAGPGNGFVDVYTTQGKLVHRFASGGALNSPWAITQGVGRLSGDILVGNFGDGRINIFNSRGQDLGAVSDASGSAIAIEGLWDVTPGVGKDRQVLFFSAGINGESDGLFGTLTIQPTRTKKTTHPALAPTPAPNPTPNPTPTPNPNPMPWMY